MTAKNASEKLFLFHDLQHGAAEHVVATAGAGMHDKRHGSRRLPVGRVRRCARNRERGSQNGATNDLHEFLPGLFYL